MHKEGYQEIKDFIFCANRMCEHTECLRHNCNTPYNTIIHRSDKFKPDKDGNCKDMVI